MTVDSATGTGLIRTALLARVIGRRYGGVRAGPEFVLGRTPPPPGPGGCHVVREGGRDIESRELMTRRHRYLNTEC